MIKLTRLSNPSEALFLNTYKVSGTVTYFELAAFEKGIQNCFGFDSSEAESFRNIEITDAGPTDLTDEDIRALQAERDDLKRKCESINLYVEALEDKNDDLRKQLTEMTLCRNRLLNEKDEQQRRYEILETTASATTLEVNRLLEANKDAWEAAGLERQACINANKEWTTEQRKHVETQKELDRVNGALHLEQLSHNKTEKELDRVNASLHSYRRQLESLSENVRKYAENRANGAYPGSTDAYLAADLFEMLDENETTDE